MIASNLRLWFSSGWCQLSLVAYYDMFGRLTVLMLYAFLIGTGSTWVRIAHSKGNSGLKSIPSVLQVLNPAAHL